MSKRKLFISKNLNIPEDKMLVIADFIVFCSESLPTSGDVCVKIVDNREKYGIKTTALYSIGENYICVYAKGRSLAERYDNRPSKRCGRFS